MWDKTSVLLTSLIFFLITYICLGIGRSAPPTGVNAIITRSIWFLSAIEIMIRIYINRDQ